MQAGERAIFDITVFDPFARRYRNQILQRCFATNENEKKIKYNQGVLEIEHGSFTPLVFALTGGCSREIKTFISRLAEKLAEKRDVQTSTVVSWLRTKINFALIRSMLLCLRCSRNLKTIEYLKSNELNIDVDEKLHRIN